MVNAFRERRALALTLTDTKTAVKKLHHIVNCVVGVIILIIWLLILGITTVHLLGFLATQLLLVVFIFGNTCKTMFESIIFLFVMHPFDVGDRCEIDGVQMVVEEMNILTTVFLRFDNQKITYPNTVLATMCIGNYYRSPDMGESIDIGIHLSTPAEKLAIFKQKITGFIQGKLDYWYPAPMVVVRDVDEMNRLKVSIWCQHRMNHQDMGERYARRAGIVEEMIKVMKLSIECFHWMSTFATYQLQLCNLLVSLRLGLTHKKFSSFFYCGILLLKILFWVLPIKLWCIHQHAS